MTPSSAIQSVMRRVEFSFGEGRPSQTKRKNLSANHQQKCIRHRGPMVRIVLAFPAAKRLAPTRRVRTSTTSEEDEAMLWGLAVVFIVLWMLGFLAFHVTTGFIHVLLVLAVVAVVFRLVTSRQTA
jgi:hypothetical protein